MKEINLKVEGMMCTGCENRIQNAVKNMNGIKRLKQLRWGCFFIRKKNADTEAVYNCFGITFYFLDL